MQAIPYENKVTSGLAHHQTSLKRQGRMSVPPESLHGLRKQESQFHRERNYWKPWSREKKSPGRRTNQRGVVTSTFKAIAACLQDPALDYFPHPNKRESYQASSSSVSLTLHAHPYSKPAKKSGCFGTVQITSSLLN